MGFTMTSEYPGSRIKTNTHCELCITAPGGVMQDSRLQLQDADGQVLEFLKWTCSICGYTMLFDLNVALRQPFSRSDYQETFPEWVEKLRGERKT